MWRRNDCSKRRCKSTTNVFGEDSERSAQIQKHLSSLYDRQDDEPRAIKAMMEAIAIATKRLGPNHYMTGYYLDALASLYLKANDLRAAEEYSRRSLEVFAHSLPPQHLYVAGARWTLGEILLRRGSAGRRRSGVPRLGGYQCGARRARTAGARHAAPRASAGP